MESEEIIEECRKRLRPLKKRKDIIITKPQESWYFREWLKAKEAEDARERFLREYQCEWPDFEDEDK